MKILLCTSSEIGGALACEVLAAAGHDVAVESRPENFADVQAGALLVDADQAKGAIRILRERGFAGRALVFGEASPDDAGADGALSTSPLEDLAQRFATALEGRRRVLIVDDSELAARLLGEELSAKGFEIHYSPSAESATRKILDRATRPDLVLLDIHMPDVDGAQFCRFLKSNDLFRGIKVVLCSGQAREKVAAVAHECGADGFILKDEFLGRWLTEQLG